MSRFTYSDQAEAAYDVVVGWMTAKDLKVSGEHSEMRIKVERYRDQSG